MFCYKNMPKNWFFRSVPRSTPKVWGITKKCLNLFNYEDLEDIYYGLFNVEIPLGMLSVQNPDEIIAQYMGSGKLKRYNRHMSGFEVISDGKKMFVPKPDIPRDFFGLVKRLDLEAYKSRELSEFLENSRIIFSSSMQSHFYRLNSLDDSVRRDFVNSFWSEYTPSLREEPTNPDSFYDPNYDGRSKKVYVNRIHRIIEDKQRFFEKL